MAPDGEAELQIQWIESSFNTSGKNAKPPAQKAKRGGGGGQTLLKRGDDCRTVCTIDETQQKGVPEVTFSSGVSKQEVVLTFAHLGLLSLCLMAWLIL
jgi:hypothetical protein